MLADRPAKIYFSFLILVLITGLIGPYVVPHDPSANLRTDDGEIKTLHEPSLEHPLGTNDRGQDVFSRLITGARPTVITGLVGGGLIIGIGMVIGITSGYVGGSVGNALMRFTDLMYGLPLIPFALILIGFLGIGFIQSVLIIGLVLWRGNARVLRSQVLQVKERPYVMSARATGAGDFYIVTRHIIPNIASMIVLFLSLGIGVSILLQASLAFIGVSDPFVPAWGVMLRRAYDSGYIAEAWWWSIPSGFAITLTVVSTFMFGRKYERVVSESSSDDALAHAG